MIPPPSATRPTPSRSGRGWLWSSRTTSAKRPRHYLGRADDPKGLFTVESTFARLIKFPSIALSTLSADSMEATCHLRIESIERFSGELNKVKAELDAASAGDKVIIACHNPAEVERLGEVFAGTSIAQSGRLELNRRPDQGRLPPDRRPDAGDRRP